ncbi:MAG: transcriptional regulator [Planctomycetaceae bacterium]
MPTLVEPGDELFLQQMHRRGQCSIQDLCAAAQVTATAVRQRLNRLQGLGFVSRETVRQGRGRPYHAYVVTELGLRQLGDNYGELALLLWNELSQLEDQGVRRSVLNRLKQAFAQRYGANVSGETLKQRLEQLGDSLRQRGFRVEIDHRDGLPILRENNCPYHELANRDRGICELEQDVFEEVLGVRLSLTQCCRDGHGCCEFQPVIPSDEAKPLI